MEWISKVLLSYLLGSIVGSLVLGRLRGVDIRQLGSGNAGSTNAIRTQGFVFGVLVAVIDAGKGWLATAVVAPAVWPFAAGAASGLWSDWLPVACAFAVIAGHVFPLFDGFRGGKGAAPLIGSLAGIAPFAIVPLLCAWLLTVAMLGYVGLATISAAWVLPLLMIATRPMPGAPLRWFALVCALFITWTHRSNIARMRDGTEPRARRLWLLGRGS